MTPSESTRPLAGAPVLEAAQIDGLLAAAGPDGVRQIMDAFWRSTDELMAAFKAQVEAGDFAEACRTAHAIKGSASNVGAALLAAAARSLEGGCEAADRSALDADLIAAADALDATRRAVEEKLAAA